MSALQLLTLEEAAERLRMGRSTLERIVASGQLAVVNVGTPKRPRLRVTEAELERFVGERTLPKPGRRNGNVA